MGQIQALHDFVEIPAAWWANNTASCVELGYGGALCEEECCSVGKAVMPLNKRQAVIANAALDTKAVFLYGTGFDGATAYHDVCDSKCWSNWAGTDYNVLKNNCNTFTSTVLSCVYGLSQKKPHLGISDMVTVSGHCPASEAQPRDPAFMFKEFEEKFERQYASAEERAARYAVFAENVEKIAAMRVMDTSAEYSHLSPFADMTDEEFRARNGFR